MATEHEVMHSNYQTQIHDVWTASFSAKFGCNWLGKCTFVTGHECTHGAWYVLVLHWRHYWYITYPICEKPRAHSSILYIAIKRIVWHFPSLHCRPIFMLKTRKHWISLCISNRYWRLSYFLRGLGLVCPFNSCRFSMSWAVSFSEHGVMNFSSVLVICQMHSTLYVSYKLWKTNFVIIIIHIWFCCERSE